MNKHSTGWSLFAMYRDLNPQEPGRGRHVRRHTRVREIRECETCKVQFRTHRTDVAA